MGDYLIRYAVNLAEPLAARDCEPKPLIQLPKKLCSVEHARRHLVTQKLSGIERSRPAVGSDSKVGDDTVRVKVWIGYCFSLYEASRRVLEEGSSDGSRDGVCSIATHTDPRCVLLDVAEGCLGRFVLRFLNGAAARLIAKGEENRNRLRCIERQVEARSAVR